MVWCDQAEEEGELSFKAGDLVEVLNQDDPG
jgi:hypothetical protein